MGFFRQEYLSGAGVQPRQDPGGTLRINGVSEREKTQETRLDSQVCEGERKKESERVTRRGVQLGLAESDNALFITIAFIP